MNWDDVKIFLALAREGSVRSAGAKLSISHATVARRINALEKKIGVRLFDRLTNGLAITVAGEDMLQSALRMEEEMNSLERRILGQDSRLEGEVRVTMPDILATNLLMPDLVEFTRKYPDIDLAILPSYDVFDLSQREADVAIRCVPHHKLPPEYLVGHRLITYAKAIYASQKYLAKFDEANASPADARRGTVDQRSQQAPSFYGGVICDLNGDSILARWIGWSDFDSRSAGFKVLRFPDWIEKTNYARIPVYHSLNSVLLQLEAVKQGMGITILPCFLGDREPNLVRLSDEIVEFRYSIWLLTHPDLRDTVRLRTFRQFISKAVEKYRDLLEGNFQRERL